MLYRVAGKLADGRTYATRIEAEGAISAVVSVRKIFSDGGVSDEQVTELHAKPMQGKSSLHIGAPKARKPGKAPSKR